MIPYYVTYFTDFLLQFFNLTTSGTSSSVNHWFLLSVHFWPNASWEHFKNFLYWGSLKSNLTLRFGSPVHQVTDLLRLHVSDLGCHSKTCFVHLRSITSIFINVLHFIFKFMTASFFYLSLWEYMLNFLF